ncbi:hypothetical protein BBA70_03075 [New Jersey aster yellows phytoplasma]|uniref:Uncharacterized protein n=1 Tax=New Jersey aster yellows phytoplasma TaxID=270520 RepID=A0ABX4K1H4_9MOLU|nr:hypothetical protein BBA70_03075 [New Jersey aster yellows phytoplasma]
MKFIGKKILCLALILNLVNFLIFIVFNVCGFSFFKKKILILIIMLFLHIKKRVQMRVIIKIKMMQKIIN